MPEYALYEIHESGERRLGLDEKPLLVQLNWHRWRKWILVYFTKTEDKFRYCYVQLVCFWKVHDCSWSLWPCRYMEVIDWCTSSPSLGSWEIPLWCIHQSGTLSTKMNPKAMTLHISPSLSQDHSIIFCLFTFSKVSLSFHNFPILHTLNYIFYSSS